MLHATFRSAGDIIFIKGKLCSTSRNVARTSNGRSIRLRRDIPNGRQIVLRAYALEWPGRIFIVRESLGIDEPRRLVREQNIFAGWAEDTCCKV